MTDPHSQNKDRIAAFRAAAYDFTEAGVRGALDDLAAPDAVFRLCHPFESVTGAEAHYDRAYAPLFAAMPDLERRDHIVMAGPDGNGAEWVGCGGYYCGTFQAPWMDIPPTGHIAHVRYHEFYRFADGRITEMQALWDLPEVMMQAGAWPMVPSLGREWHIPGPGTQDGIVPGPWDEAQSTASCQHIVEMLEYMKRHPSEGGPEVMELPRFWHPKMMWYGPSGIGSGRGVDGFRKWHQIPFLNGMPDRGLYVEDITYHFFGDGNFAGVTGWPDMIQSVTHDGWLGIAPQGRKIDMRSLDFWRLEDGLIRENWVLVDLLHMWHQLDVDVLARMREFNKARIGFDPDTGRALETATGTHA